MEAAVNLDTAQLLAIAAALGWASGLRLYAVVFLTGLAGHLGWVSLPEGLVLLSQPTVLWGSGALLLVEFVADKVPLVDSAWDALHTIIRIPAGAALAASVFGFDAGQATVLAGLMGGTLAATSHLAKASTRAAVNTSPEPFSNLVMSLLGDAAVPVMLWLSWVSPTTFYVVLALSIIAALAMTVFLFKFVRALWRRVVGRRSALAV